MIQQQVSKIRIGLVQAKVRSQIEANLDRTAKYVHETARKGATIVCLQELFAVPYFAQQKDRKFLELAERIPGRIVNFLSSVARENNITLVAGSLYEKGEDKKYYNTALVLNSNGKIIAKYRKIHIPNDPKYYEKYYFSSGNLGYAQVDVNKVRIAPLVCYDQWYPEAARINALKGAQIIFYPTAIGWTDDMRKNEHFSAERWRNAMCGNASMNGLYVAAVNRVGKEQDIDFWGGSFVADPYGEVVKEASSTKEEVLVVDIDLRKVTSSREGWGFLRNRQPLSYKDLIK